MIKLFRLILILLIIQLYTVHAVIIEGELKLAPTPSFQEPSGRTESIGTTPNIVESSAYRTASNVYISSSNHAQSPLNIKKKILNNNGSFWVGEPIYVLVELQCLEDKWIDDIEIAESIDKDLIIQRYYKSNRTNDFNCTVNDQLFCENQSFCEQNGTLYFYEAELRKKEKIYYQYEVIPKRSGTHSLETIVRVGDVDSFFSDYYNTLEISVTDPVFDVRLDIENLEGEPDTSLPVTYIVRSKPEHEAFLKMHSLSAKIEKISNNNNVVIAPNFISELKFNSTENRTNAEIKFRGRGQYSLPNFVIANNTYSFEDRIEIEERWHKYIAEISLIFLGICTVIGPNFKSFFLRRKSTKIISVTTLLIVIMVMMYFLNFNIFHIFILFLATCSWAIYNCCDRILIQKRS